MHSLTKEEYSVTIHSTTTSSEEAWAKMKEAADQTAEQFQTLQPTYLFNESSPGHQITFGFKSWGGENVWHK